jgi:hypothetical protein
MAEEPEDLGVKIGTKREAWWTEVKVECEKRILHGEETLVIDKVLLEMAEKAIAEEQSKK